jgi:acetyl-CoA carboxylase biotin carboxyl carrier protein
MSFTVAAELVGTVHTVEVAVGDPVAAGDTIILLESMKMEIPVLTEIAGTVREVAVAKGDNVMEGDTIAVIEEDA